MINKIIQYLKIINITTKNINIITDINYLSGNSIVNNNFNFIAIIYHKEKRTLKPKMKRPTMR